MWLVPMGLHSPGEPTLPLLLLLRDAEGLPTIGLQPSMTPPQEDGHLAHRPHSPPGLVSSCPLLGSGVS